MRYRVRFEKAAMHWGGTKFDVSVKVVIPAAFSGIVAAFLLAIARAVGETMIVALAAGSLPVNIVQDGIGAAADPTRQVQTMTGYIVQIFLGDLIVELEETS